MNIVLTIGKYTADPATWRQEVQAKYPLMQKKFVRIYGLNTAEFRYQNGQLAALIFSGNERHLRIAARLASDDPFLYRTFFETQPEAMNWRHYIPWIQPQGVRAYFSVVMPNLYELKKLRIQLFRDSVEYALCAYKCVREDVQTLMTYRKTITEDHYIFSAIVSTPDAALDTLKFISQIGGIRYAFAMVEDTAI